MISEIRLNLLNIRIEIWKRSKSIWQSLWLCLKDCIFLSSVFRAQVIILKASTCGEKHTKVFTEICNWTFERCFVSLPKKLSKYRLSNTLTWFNIFVHFVIFDGVHLIFKLSSRRRLTHFRPMFPFYIPWRRQKTIGFLTFSGSIGREHWPEI